MSSVDLPRPSHVKIHPRVLLSKFIMSCLQLLVHQIQCIQIEDQDIYQHQ